MAFSWPAPIVRAGTVLPLWLLSQSSQSGYHEPRCSCAVASHLSTSAPLGASPVQYWYFGLAGGLTTPAIWPEPASTYFTVPPKNCEPYSTDFAGVVNPPAKPKYQYWTGAAPSGAAPVQY